ncbi:MAG: Sialic acid TRAP transporter permease protein SiaT [Actinobacteria bacterium ADurb.Bin444]|nr:MAG: Sialic acid TRAP transporter permease protein SiaT [Actinobacteria bacterium ADurb.Bin444]
MSDVTVALLGVLVLVILMMLELPVAFCMFVIGFLGLWIIQGRAQAFNIIGADIWGQFSSYGMSVVPFFILMGNIAFRAGVTSDLFRAAYTWIGQVRGGMAVTTVVASSFFGAICGSNAATAATMGTIALPAMKKFGYADGLSAGSVAAGGTLGVMIPPSVVLIVIGIQYNLSIAKLFVAELPAGILLTLLFAITVLLICWSKPQLGPAGPKTTFVEKIKGLLGVIETLVLFVFVIGGMFAGWFTPTEGGAMGSFGAIVIALARRKLTWKSFKQACWDTISTSTMVIVLVAGAVVLGRFLTAAYLPTELANWATGLDISRFWVLMVVVVIYVLGGMFSDALGFLTLSVPVFFPLAEALGYNVVWFAVLVTVITTFGAISPPVGVNLYVVKGLQPDMPIATIMKGAMWFVPSYVVCLALLIIFPQLVTALVSVA